MITRRSLLGGMVALIAAPAIVRVSSLMRLSPAALSMTVAEYEALVLRPMIEKTMAMIARQMKDTIMFGTSVASVEFHGIEMHYEVLPPGSALIERCDRAWSAVDGFEAPSYSRRRLS